MPLCADGKLRVLRRRSIRPAVAVSIRTVRPSVLDPRLAGDPGLVDPQGEAFALRFGDRRVASVSGLGLDLPSLTQLIDRVRRRRPRRGR